MECINRQRYAKKDLREQADLTTNAVAKLEKNEHVFTEVLVCIYEALECDIYDIVELEKMLLEIEQQQKDSKQSSCLLGLEVQFWFREGRIIIDWTGSSRVGLRPNGNLFALFPCRAACFRVISSKNSGRIVTLRLTIATHKHVL